MSTTSDLAESQEVCILCSIWDSVGTYCMQERYVGPAHQDCGNFLPTSPYDNKTTKGYIWLYMILLKFYKGICGDHNVDGETVEEGCEVRMER